MSIQELQSMFQQLNNLSSDLELLKQRIQRAPCISLSGLRNLELYKTARQCDKQLTIHTLIYMLFKLLKIPKEWILQIGHPPKIFESNHSIPFEAYIYLTNDSTKLLVYQLLLKHIRKTKQKAVHVKIINY
jgi:hypothetical protein